MTLPQAGAAYACTQRLADTKVEVSREDSDDDDDTMWMIKSTSNEASWGSDVWSFCTSCVTTATTPTPPLIFPSAPVVVGP